MIKRKYIKRIYIEEMICDKCGAEMHRTNHILTSYPEKLIFKCSKCGREEIISAYEFSGGLKFEFDEEI